MKSRVKKSTEDSTIMLSIGLIVKNEEEVLRRCLESIQPLREKIKLEIIIVDTGSTDGTVEIAQEYADKLLFFEWTGDFSEARNYGLSKAVGEWFMFIDADEYFDEDVKEFIDFFTMPEVNKQYNSASIMLRSYYNETRTKYSDFLAERIARRLPGVKFSYPIHEHLEMPIPHGCFSTVLHHTGYIKQDRESVQKKVERNLPEILEAYKRNPKEPRTLTHLIDATIDKTEREKYMKEFIEVVRENPNYNFRNIAYLKYANFLMSFNRYDEAKDYLEEMLSYENIKNCVTRLDAFANLAIIYEKFEDYEKCYEYSEKYFEYYDMYENRQLSLLVMRCGVLRGTLPNTYQAQVITASNALYKLGRNQEALDILDKVDIEFMHFINLRAYFSIIRNLVSESKDYSKFVYHYNKVQQLGDDDKTDLVMYMIEMYYLEHPFERAAIAKTMVASDIKGDMVDIMKLIISQNEPDIAERVKRVVDKAGLKTDGYAMLIYLAMKYDVDIKNRIPDLTYSRIRNHMQLLGDSHEDFARIVISYCQTEKFTGSIKEMMFMCTAMEYAVMNDGGLVNDEKAVLFHTFATVLSDYVANIYNPELFNSVEDVEILPPLHRFGYYIGVAQTCLYDGDSIGYIQNIKDGLSQCPDMKGMVAFLVDELSLALK